MDPICKFAGPDRRIDAIAPDLIKANLAIGCDYEINTQPATNKDTHINSLRFQCLEI
jgi:hypothetical protein